MISSNLCVRPSLIIKIFFLIITSSDELLSTLKTTTVLPQSKFISKKSEQESNPIPYQE